MNQKIIAITASILIAFLLAIGSGYAIHLKSSDFELQLDPPKSQAAASDNPVLTAH